MSWYRPPLSQHPFIMVEQSVLGHNEEARRAQIIIRKMKEEARLRGWEVKEVCDSGRLVYRYLFRPPETKR